MSVKFLQLVYSIVFNDIMKDVNFDGQQEYGLYNYKFYLEKLYMTVDPPDEIDKKYLEKLFSDVDVDVLSLKNALHKLQMHNLELETEIQYLKSKQIM